MHKKMFRITKNEQKQKINERKMRIYCTHKNILAERIPIRLYVRDK